MNVLFELMVFYFLWLFVCSIVCFVWRKGNKRKGTNARYNCNLDSSSAVLVVMQTYFACKTRANIPAARGAADDVPLNSSVHLWCKSVVTWDKMKKKRTFYRRKGMFLSLMYRCVNLLKTQLPHYNISWRNGIPSSALFPTDVSSN